MGKTGSLLPHPSKEHCIRSVNSPVKAQEEWPLKLKKWSIHSQIPTGQLTTSQHKITPQSLFYGGQQQQGDCDSPQIWTCFPAPCESSIWSCAWKREEETHEINRALCAFSRRSSSSERGSTIFANEVSEKGEGKRRGGIQNKISKGKDGGERERNGGNPQ